jgi:hypothetical protein
VTGSTAGSENDAKIGEEDEPEEPEEIQKLAALDATGKTWREWLYRDFFRYFIWTLALFEALVLIGITATLTSLSQYNPLLIAGVTLLSLLLNYFFVYRRFWRKKKEKQSRETDANIFERIK